MLLDVGPAASPAPSVTYAGKPVLVYRNEDRWTAAVGVPLDAEPGSAAALVGGKPREFEVRGHDYPEQRLKIANREYVTPNQQQLDRIGRERVIIDNALNNWRDETLESIALRLNFLLPQFRP